MIQQRQQLLDEIDTLTVEELQQALARSEHLAFMSYCWAKPNLFKIGRHTIAFCEAIDKAIDRFREGQSSFILGEVCFGHGKSEIVSNYLPAHFIGEFPDKDILVTSYSMDKVSDFSVFNRRLMQTGKYQELYPEITLDPNEQNIAQFGIASHFGKVMFAGIDGTITGKHSSLIIVDDYCKGRAEAESATTRQSTWEAFTNNILTRRIDPCIVFVLCTPWHQDDIAGRIEAMMNDDPDFPKFEIIRFPATSDIYPTGYLFPEMYSPVWYKTQASALGTYGTASLMQCSPTQRGGTMLRIDKVKFYDDITEVKAQFPYLLMKRAWDLASSKKEQMKDSPDYTVGIRGAVQSLPSAIRGIDTPILIIDDVVRGQWEATKRQQIILDTAMADGLIEIGIEAFAAYKDAYTSLAEILFGIRKVRKMQLPGDKVAKVDPLVPVFEAGNVYMKRGPWNQEVLSVLADFPSGKHDDDADALAVLFAMFKPSEGFVDYRKACSDVIGDFQTLKWGFLNG